MGKERPGQWAMLFADDLVLCDPDREMMELRLERWRECMEKNGLKVSRAKTDHLQTTGDTDPVRMERYMEIEMILLPTVQSFKYLPPDIPDSVSTDVALRLGHMANVSKRLKAYGNDRDENGAMGNGGEPVRTPEK